MPLFFEIHRMSAFSARSLDVDVVLDLMIHDIDLVLDMVGQAPEEVRAAGIRMLRATMSADNAPSLRLMKSMTHGLEVRYGAGQMEVVGQAA
jgi:predicted dehydrogenase